MMEKNLYPEIPKEKFAFIHKDERIHDEKLQTKSISYLGDAWLRFRKNKSSVVAFCLIVFLLLFAIITPFVSPYTVQFRDGYYKSVLPKNTLLKTRVSGMALARKRSAKSATITITPSVRKRACRS